MKSTAVFLDTALVLALSIKTDVYHQPALTIATQLKRNATPLVTTRAIIVEIGNSLSKLRYRQVARQLLQTLEADPQLEIVPLSERLYQKAFQLFGSRPDKECGLIDCISFVVMPERGLTEALTTDKHFPQAGFRALLMATS
jgi:hypothetical protein